MKRLRNPEAVLDIEELVQAGSRQRWVELLDSQLCVNGYTLVVTCVHSYVLKVLRAVLCVM